VCRDGGCTGWICMRNSVLNMVPPITKCAGMVAILGGCACVCCGIVREAVRVICCACACVGRNLMLVRA
jgi:hypothetical protein